MHEGFIGDTSFADQSFEKSADSPHFFEMERFTGKMPSASSRRLATPKLSA
jgi:hypothetical protein